MSSGLIEIIGLAIVITSLREMILSFRRGSFRARGGRTIRRSIHPVMFWVNFGGLFTVFILGSALIGLSFLMEP